MKLKWQTLEISCESWKYYSCVLRAAKTERNHGLGHTLPKSSEDIK